MGCDRDRVFTRQQTLPKISINLKNLTTETTRVDYLGRWGEAKLDVVT